MELRTLKNYGIQHSFLNEVLYKNYRKETYKIYKELPLRAAETCGLKFSNSTDPLLLTEMFLANEYDINGFTPSEGELVVDVGANVGDSALWWWKKYGAKVVAFEPLISTFKILKENIELNGADVIIHNIALGDGKDITGGIKGSMFSINGNNKFSTIPLDQFELKEVKILKIDVEGFELEVLKGAEETLKFNNPKIIIETHSTELRQKCHQFLTNMGYTLRIEGRTVINKSPGMDKLTNLFYSI